MALPSVTYERYRDLGGTLPRGAFSASLGAAVRAVREVVGFNAPEDADDVEAYERAVRAAVDVDSAYGASGGIGERVASVTLGRFSATSATSATSGMTPYDADMTRAIMRELSGSSLLYQGL